jgi:zinc transport system substrate-binding protein
MQLTAFSRQGLKTYLLFLFAKRKSSKKKTAIFCAERKKSSLRWLCLFILLFAGALLCGQTFAAETYPIKVAAGIYPVADMARNVGGRHVEVTAILPPGASPHTFEPAPSAMREFSRARLFIRVGAGLEFWAEKLVATAGRGLKVVTLSEGMQLLGSDEHGHGAEHANPHVWLDPVLAMEMVRKIEKALSDIDPANSADYRRNADNYVKEIKVLDEEIRRAVASFRVRSFVSFHAAWDYFARRYGLQGAGVIQEAPGREPGPRKIEALIKEVRARGIRAVFAESQFSPRAAEVIAREAGVKVVVLDPEGGAPGRETYLKMMRFNLERMSEAMK